MEGSRWSRCCQGNREVGQGVWLEGGILSHPLLPLGGVGPSKEGQPQLPGGGPQGGSVALN